MRRWTATLLAVATATCTTLGITPHPAVAQGLVWATAQATRGDTIEAFDAAGARVHAFAAAGGTASGIAVVGNVVYYTAGSSIYKMDATTGAGLGVIATTLSFGMPTLAWDGANFWTSEARPSGSTQLFRIGLDGVVNKTILLSAAAPSAYSFPNDLEYFGGKLIVNPGGPIGLENVYDLDGNVLQAGFTSGPVGPIAFDGTNFLALRGYRLDMTGVVFDVRSGTTGAVLGTRTLPAPQSAYGDISFDYAGRADLVSSAPEPGTVALVAAGLGVLAVAARRRRADA